MSPAPATLTNGPKLALPPLLYLNTPLDTLTILNEAWHLVKGHIQSCLIVMCPALFCFALQALAVAYLQTFKTMGLILPEKLLALLSAAGLVVISGCLSTLVLILSGSVMAYLFYHHLLGVTPKVTLRSSMQVVLAPAMMVKLCLLALALSIVYLIMGVLDVFVVGFTLVMSALLVTPLLTMVVSSPIYTAGKIIFIVCFALLGMLALIGILALQFIAAVLPYFSLVLVPKSSVWSSVINAMRIIWYQWPQAMACGVLMLVFTGVLSVVMNTPILIWAGFELSRYQGVPQAGISLNELPFYVNLAINAWAHLGNVILIPYMTAVVTLLWTDSQLQRDGLNLNLQLDWIKQQQKGFSPASS